MFLHNVRVRFRASLDPSVATAGQEPVAMNHVRVKVLDVGRHSW